MAWVERADKRGKSSKLFQSDTVPGKFAFNSQVATAWHYRSDPDSETYDTEVDFTPQRVLPGELPGRWSTFNGWIVREGDFYYGLTTTGNLWFVGRGGYRGLGHTLLRSGYVKWSTREWASFINATPTWDTGQLTSQVNQVIVNSSGKTLNVENIAVWHDLYPQLPSGNLDLRIQAHGNGLKANPTFDAAAVAWITANRPPTYYFPGTPASDTYLSMLFTLDVADFIRADEPIVFKRDGILQNLIDFDDLDGGANLELSDYLGRVIGWLPVDYALAIDPVTGSELARIKLRKRIYISGGVYYLLVGARTDLLAAMLNAHPGSELVFDPTIDTAVGSGADDTRRYGSTSWSVTGTRYVGNGPGIGIAKVSDRFTGISGLSGATIGANTYITPLFTNNGAAVKTIIRAEVGAAPAQITAYDDFDNRTRTTATVTWDDAVAGFERVNSPSIASVIQEIADSYDPSVIQTFWADDSSASGNWHSMPSYEDSASWSTQIHIEFTAGGSPPAAVLPFRALLGVGI